MFVKLMLIPEVEGIRYGEFVVKTFYLAEQLETSGAAGRFIAISCYQLMAPLVFFVGFQ